MSGRPSEDSSHRGHGESSTGSETADEEFSRAETPRQEIATATTVEVEIKEDAILFVSYESTRTLVKDKSSRHFRKNFCSARTDSPSDQNDRIPSDPF